MYGEVYESGQFETRFEDNKFDVELDPERFVVQLESGAELSVNRRGRCEDAPCCGCCY